MAARSNSSGSAPYGPTSLGANDGDRRRNNRTPFASYRGSTSQVLTGTQREALSELDSRRPLAQTATKGDAEGRQAIPRLSGLGVVVITATVVGGLIRYLATSPHQFPADDGGMFTVMMANIREARFGLPAHSTYNGLNLPFAYPPLGLWFAAVWGFATDMSDQHTLILIPLIFSTALIPAFFLVARELLPTQRLAAFAVLVFAAVPRSFDREVVGGGVTRAPGFLFALLATWQLSQLVDRPSKRRLGAATALSALATLSHPEMGLFVAVAGASLAAVKVRTRRTAIHLGCVGVLVAVVTSPWWLSVVVRLGFAPFFSAATTGGHSSLMALRILAPTPFDEPLFPIIASLGFLGALVSLGRRDWLLPLWLLSAFVLDPRKAATNASVPLSMLAAIAIDAVVLRIARGEWAETHPLRTTDGPSPRLSARERAALYVVFGLIAAGAVASPLAPQSTLRVLSPATRQSMGWIQIATPQDARFLVVTGSGSWARDAVSEWFPALASRESLATVQGYEWLGSTRFERQMSHYADLQRCASANADCLEAWSTNTGRSFDYVFLPRHPYVGLAYPPGDDGDPDPVAALRLSLSTSPDFRLVRNDPGGTVFERIASPTAIQ